MINKYKIVFYKDSAGDCEIRDFFHKLDISNQRNDVALLKKVKHQMDMLEKLGPKLNEPQSKALIGYEYPINELRPMPERFFYARWQGNKYVLLHHYTKKMYKTDPRELHKALNKLNDWYTRKGK